MNTKQFAEVVHATNRALLQFISGIPFLLFVLTFIFAGPGGSLDGSLVAAPGEDEPRDLNEIFNEQIDVPAEAQGGESTGTNSGSAKTGSDSLFSFRDYAGRTYELDLMGAVDMVGEWDKERDTNLVKEGRSIYTYFDRRLEEAFAPRTSASQNRATIRSIEIGLYADIDHLARGTLMIAAHDEGGVVYYDIHEAHFFFPVTPIPNLSVQVGRFFLDAGRLNTTHQHDWPFTRTPLVHEKLLAKEGVGDFGVQFHYLMPWSFMQELTVGVFNGRHFGHAHDEGPKKQNPLFTARLKQFVSITDDLGTQFGFSYLRFHPDPDPNRVSHQSGMDLLFKWNRGKSRSVQWVSEVWYRETRDRENHAYEDGADPVKTEFGYYSFLEYQFLENWYAGLRYDMFHEPTKRAEVGYRRTRGVTLSDLDPGGTTGLPSELTDQIYVTNGWTESMTVKNRTTEGAFMITYKPSEFSYFRATYTRRHEQLYRDTDNIVSLQMMFIIGMHPAHQY